MHNSGTPAWTLIIIPPTPAASPRRLGSSSRPCAGFCARPRGSRGSMAVDSRRDGVGRTNGGSSRRGATPDRRAVRNRCVSSRRIPRRVAKTQPPIGMFMPVSGEITSPFSRSRFHPILQVFRAHRGVDVAAPAGTPIHAPAAGTVVSFGRWLGFGPIARYPAPRWRCHTLRALPISARATR